MTAIHWLNPVGGGFTNGADWSGGVVPGAADDAVIDAKGAPYTVKVVADVTVDSIQLANHAALAIKATTGGGVFTASAGTGSGSNAGRISINDGAKFDVTGRVRNSGRIVLKGDHQTTLLDVGPPGLTLSGGGIVALSDSSTNEIVNFEGIGTPKLINVDNSIVGAGYVGGYTLSLSNMAKGVISATGSTALTVVGTVLVNAGLMEADGAGGLGIRGHAIVNTGGVILAGSGSTVYLTDHVVGGTLATQGSGLIRCNATVLDGMSGSIDIMGTVTGFEGEHYSSIEMDGAIANSGTIDGSYLVVGTGNATLSGGGMVNTDRLIGTFKTTVLVNADNTIVGQNDNIYGYGNIGAGILVLVNESLGTIVAPSSVTLKIDTGTAVIDNAGVIETEGRKSLLTIAGGVENTGLLAVNAGTLIANGAVSGDGFARIDGGLLKFTQAFDQDVNFTGDGRLSLAESQSYTASISGFSVAGSTALDLGDIGFVGSDEATFSGTATSGILTVTDGSHTAQIHLNGDYLGATFAASDDGKGGTSVIATSGAASAPPHRLIASMAALGGAAGEAVHLGLAWTPRESALARPHAIA